MTTTNFRVMNEVVRVRAMLEFVHQDCVTLLGFSGAHKHSCALKPLSILNASSITTFLSLSLSTCLKWKILKTFKEVNGTGKIFCQMSASWCDHLNEGVNKLTRGISFVGVSRCTTGAICFNFVLWRHTSYFLI